MINSAVFDAQPQRGDFFSAHIHARALRIGGGGNAVFGQGGDNAVFKRAHNVAHAGLAALEID